MPGTTPGGLPYPLGTEPVRDGDNAIKNLAEAIDPKLFTVRTNAATYPYAAVPPAGSRIILQTGIYSGSVLGGGLLIVTYPQPFPNGVLSFIGIPVSGAHYISINGRAGVNTAQTTFVVFGAGGATVTPGTGVDINWTAIGW